MSRETRSIDLARHLVDSLTIYAVNAELGKREGRPEDWNRLLRGLAAIEAAARRLLSNLTTPADLETLVGRELRADRGDPTRAPVGNLGAYEIRAGPLSGGAS
jgi:hypothetical protein